MQIKSPVLSFLCLMLAGCESKPDGPSLADEVIAVQVADNQRRCVVKEPALVRCEYESWGAEKILIKLESSKVFYHNVSKKELSVQFELDDRFPSMDYKIGRDKDLLYTQLEQSGYCAFSEVEKEQQDDKKSKKSRALPRTMFIPATIITGLMDDGVVFLRKWSIKKPPKKKKVNQEESRPIGFGASSKSNPQDSNPLVATDHEELTLDCVVALRGSEELGPGPGDKDKTGATSTSRPTESVPGNDAKSKPED